MFRRRSNPFTGWIATQECSFSWLFRTPGWASADPIAQATLRRLRISAAIWNLVVMPLFLLAGFLSSILFG
jgi:hypothetical protein